MTYSFPNLEPICFSMSSSNSCFWSCIQISQEAGKVVWYSHLWRIFQFVIHTVKCFGIVNKEVDIFLELSCFFDDPLDVDNLISGSSSFSKSSLNIWKFMVHILLKPALENFEHYFASVWDECDCAVVWALFRIAFLWDCNENWPFLALWPLLSFPNSLAYWVKWSDVAQLYPTLCDPLDCSLPGSSVHGIFQAIVLEWIAISFSRGSSQPRDRTRVSRIVDRRFTVWATIECSTLTASSFRIWNSSTGIPSPPLALFIVMLSKAHLTSHSKMSGSRWVITSIGIIWLVKICFVQFFCVFLLPLLNIFCFC